MARRLLRFVAAAIVFVFGVELCARLDDFLSYDAPLGGEYSASNLMSKDGDGVPYNIPDARFEKWRHNSLGFRGPEVAPTKPAGTSRVVCMGTSESYGLYESPGMEWPAQLQAMLPKEKCEVINASVVGLDLRSYAAYLSKHVYPIHPDLVVLVVSPLVYVTLLERAASGQGAGVRAGGGPQPRTGGLTGELIRQSRLLPKAKQAVKRIVAGNFPEALRRYQIANLQRQIAGIERARLKGRKPADSIPEAYLAAFREDLRLLVESIRSRGIEVMLATSPSLMDPGNLAQHPEIFLDSRRFFIELSLAGMIDAVSRINQVIADAAAEQQTLFVDMAALLPRSTEYFSDNSHFTDRGAQIIAAAVAASIRSQLTASGGRSCNR